MTRDELLAGLAKCAENDDYEAAHANADQYLIDYIGDVEIANAYAKVGKWYA